MKDKKAISYTIKIRKCAGILFAEETSGRRARVAGTGIEVREIIAAYQSVKKDLKRLKKAHHWLSREQLRAALGYYSAYPREMDRQIAQNERWDEEKVRERHPFLSSPS